MRITKAVFPVAGLGSRFLPATKANPKEMLPIADKPLIQYAVEEAARAGITHMIFITSSGKRAIEDHFDSNFELEMQLKLQGKEHSLDLVRQITPDNIQFTYIRQNQPLGLGHAILCSQHVVGDEPFAVLLADDLIDDSLQPCLSAMIAAYNEHGQSVLAVQEVEWSKVEQYGIVKIEKFVQQLTSILEIVEKPSPNLAPSNIAAVGRYIFTPAIFSCLQKISAAYNNELQLTDAIQRLLTIESVQAYKFLGKRYDCGSKLGYLQAIVEFALRHPDLGKGFQQYLHKLLS